MMQIQYILTDIEGTTTSVNFVYEVLFPYFKNHFQDFLEKEGHTEIVLHQFELVKKTILEEENRVIGHEEVIKILYHWVEKDRKHPALKNLQGMVWKEGYEKGELKGHIYEDVPPAFEKWKNLGITIGIYSSGSVEAQKLIFGSSIFGDLCIYLSHYFDTAVGAKRESSSYQKIQEELKIPSEEILFVSDVEAELDAAKEVGFQTIQLIRPGTNPGSRHHKVESFKEIQI